MPGVQTIWSNDWNQLSLEIKETVVNLCFYTDLLSTDFLSHLLLLFEEFFFLP